MERFIKLPYSVLDTLKGEQLLRYIDLLRMVDWRTGNVVTSCRELGEKWKIDPKTSQRYIKHLQCLGLVDYSPDCNCTSIHIKQYDTPRQNNNKSRIYKNERHTEQQNATPNATPNELKISTLKRL
ncbi:MAG: hypothetical protein K6D59_04490 [Bacteroidales bacterium]|nr:hypothetical protein [Bacteroidales bacterium]